MRFSFRSDRHVERRDQCVMRTAFARKRRSAVQNVSASDGPMSMPRTSRRPSLLTTPQRSPQPIDPLVLAHIHVSGVTLHIRPLASMAAPGRPSPVINLRHIAATPGPWRCHVQGPYREHLFRLPPVAFREQVMDSLFVLQRCSPAATWLRSSKPIEVEFQSLTRTPLQRIKR